MISQLKATYSIINYFYKYWILVIFFVERSNFIFFFEWQLWGGSSPSAALGLVDCFPGTSPILWSTQRLWRVIDGTTCDLQPSEIRLLYSVDAKHKVINYVTFDWGQKKDCLWWGVCTLWLLFFSLLLPVLKK